MQASTASVASAIVLIILVILIIYELRELFPPDPLTRTKYIATPDGKRFRVHKQFRDAPAAAALLSYLDDRATDLIRTLYHRYHDDPGPKGDAARRLLARYNPDNLVESSPDSAKKDTSYSIDKGAIIAMCLRSRDGSYRIHDMNLLTFVLIHELTHVAADVNDHPPEFWRIFKFLLAEAEAGGIIRNEDYSKRPVEYCGLQVDFNPFFTKN